MFLFKDRTENKAFQAKLNALFADPDALSKRVHERFNEFATLKQGEAKKTLDSKEVVKVVKWMAGMLEVKSDVFGDIKQMVERYDFNCDGHLDENEACKMCLSLLRTYRDSVGSKRKTFSASDLEICDVKTKYDIGKKLGQGGQGAVYLASRKTDKKQVVLKYYDKSDPNAPVEDILIEFELMKGLNHPRIARYFHIFQNHANIYVVSEPYHGGDLKTAKDKAIENNVEVTEAWLAGIWRQVLQGVDYLHTQDVMHCDLKEENAMITHDSDWNAPQVVVIDFGLSKLFHNKSYPAGTPGYMPPEVWENGLWTPRGDVFSLAVLMVSMAQGIDPFRQDCRTIEDVKRRTKKHEPKLEGSQSYQDILTKMLDKQFRKRPSVKEVLNSSFINGGDATRPKARSKIMPSKVHQGDHQNEELKRALLADLAARRNLAEMRELNDLFAEMDIDNDGLVTEQEARAALEKKWKKKDVDEFVKLLVQDSAVAYEEFMGTLIHMREPEENKILEEMFQEMDVNGDGSLSKEEIERVLEKPAIKRVLGEDRTPKELMEHLDANDDGKVTFEEFQHAVENKIEGKDAKKKRMRVRVNGHFVNAGDDIEYWSVTHEQWIACKVSGTDPQGSAVEVDVKPGYWIHGNELSAKLKLPTSPGIKETSCWACIASICSG